MTDYPTGPYPNQVTMWPWPTRSTQQECDHCYCKDVPTDQMDPEYTFIDSPEPHKKCCRCSNLRAARFVSAGGRAKE